MTTTVQTLIDQANAKTTAARKKVFAKKASDQQHHENLYRNVRVALDVYHSLTGLADNNFRCAMRELEGAMTLSKKRLGL